ncbi:hypothetical protein [Streptomyces sp. NPDC001604]|uniref:hypothetical protein n=1 Tax=Streptomyces sp. NPDC001604 TaxID=3364593 RepID=UPI0036C4F599
MSPAVLDALTRLLVSSGAGAGPAAHLGRPPRPPAHEQPVEDVGAESQRVVETLEAVAGAPEERGEPR